MSPRTILPASQSVNPANTRYLPFGCIDEELVSAGGVVLGGVDGVLVPLDDELDGGGVLGDGDGVVDDDDVPGEGVTTGGVFGEVVDDCSRLQPAMPTASPAQSSVINVLFITISDKLRTGCPPQDLADSMPFGRAAAAHAVGKMPSEISAVVNRIHAFCVPKLPEAPTCGAQISSGAGNNYARFRSKWCGNLFTKQIHAHGFIGRTVRSLRGNRHFGFHVSHSQCLMP